MKDWLTFSTTDLKHWHQHPVGLDISAFKWADSKQAFAGHVAKRNGKYYLTYAVSWPERMGYSFAVKAITTDAQMLEENADGVAVKNQKLTLIPYYAWNHRGAGEMNVWFVQSLKMLDK